MSMTFADVHGPNGAVPPLDRAHEIVSGLGEGFISVDADWRLTDCNREAERLLDAKREDLLGCKLWSVSGLPKDSAFADLSRQVAVTRRPVEAELAYRGRRGRARLLRMRAFPLGGGFAAVWRDLTQARAAERRMALDAARYREVADDLPTAAWMSRADGKLIFINQAMADALGRPAPELLGNGWMTSLAQEDRDGLLLARSQARASHGNVTYEGRFVRPDGEMRIIQLYGRPRFTASGAFSGHVGIAVDVTDVRVAEQRQRVLINELNHRVKNALATVQSLVRQTLREHEVAPDVQAALDERIMALAGAHDILTRKNWQPAALADIAEEATRAHGQDGRISIAGPDARISPQTAIPLSMALHELATNAVKYGALSNAAGQVRIGWQRDGDLIVIEWRESGGPPVVPPIREGFGSRLLGRLLKGEFGAPAELDYAPGGLVCRIRAPAERT